MNSIVYGIFSALLGAAVGAAITYCFSVRLFKHQRRIEAAAKFREAFIEELIACRKHGVANGSIKIDSVIEQALPKHEKAMIRYRPFVKTSNLHEFDKAWKMHHSHEGRQNSRFKPVHDIGHDNDWTGISEKEYKNIVESKILRLFSFAPTE